jgi:hypothetical protein
MRAVVATLYAAAMLALGFAHAPIVAPSAAEAALASLAAALPQGAVVSLCGDPRTPEDSSRPVRHKPDCAACQLVAAPGLAPAPDATVLPRSSYVALVAGGAEDAPPTTRDAVRPPSRGPPLT